MCLISAYRHARVLLNVVERLAALRRRFRCRFSAVLSIRLVFVFLLGLSMDHDCCPSQFILPLPPAHALTHYLPLPSSNWQARAENKCSCCQQCVNGQLKWNCVIDPHLPCNCYGAQYSSGPLPGTFVNSSVSIRVDSTLRHRRYLLVAVPLRELSGWMCLLACVRSCSGLQCGFCFVVLNILCLFCWFLFRRHFGRTKDRICIDKNKKIYTTKTNENGMRTGRHLM